MELTDFFQQQSLNAAAKLAPFVVRPSNPITGAALPQESPVGPSAIAPSVSPFNLLSLIRVVEDYGADRSGNADSTAAFQNAIAAVSMAGSGGTIWVASGVYRVNISMANTPNVSFIAGGEVTLTSADGVSNTLSITGTSGKNIFSGFFRILGPTGGTGACIYVNTTFSNNDWITFEDVLCFGGTNCIKVDSSFAVYFDRLLITGHTAEGVLLTGNNVNTVWIHQLIGGQPGQTSWRCRGGTGIRIDSCDLEVQGRAIIIDPPAGSQAAVIYLNNLAIDTCGSGPAITIGGGGGTVEMVYITNPFVEFSSGSGIDIESGVSHVHITNPYSSNNSGDGILINSATATDIHVNGGTLNDNTNLGFAVNAAVIGFSIIGTTVTGNSNGNIFVSAAASDYYRIMLCDTHNSISDSGTGAHKLVGAIGTLNL